MTTTYEVGSICEDCLSDGMQNYLKLFYINLEEQIIKCESSRCMFPFLRKNAFVPTSESKHSQFTLSLDDFIEESAKQLNTSPTKPTQEVRKDQIEDVSVLFDFSSLFTSSMSKPKSEVKKEEKHNPVLVPKTEPLSIEDRKLVAKERKLSKVQLPKPKILRHLTKSKNSPIGNSNYKVFRAKKEWKEPSLIVEPGSGRAMRPLDLISHYMKTSNQSSSDEQDF